MLLSLKNSKDNSIRSEKNFDKIITFAGIANNSLFLKKLSEYSDEIIKHSFPDHHYYSDAEINLFIKEYQKLNTENKAIITTEKDFYRLAEHQKNKLKDNCIFLYVGTNVLFKGDIPDLEQFL